MDDDVKRLEAEAVTLRRVAFVGVAISTVATLVCVVSVPLLYNYMQHMQSIMQSEVDFCKSRSGNIWREITRTQVSVVGFIANLLLILKVANNLTNNWGPCCLCSA
ncbi:unnamed protein product [Cylicostephanus goldi]|uniref:Nematode cuticle collagen N-terminal domain-containing protein n=1 Tax=Cylicostephanus goldi TaxID=71465 RepID=A0A3P7MV24_CYLGO|nr:unnamed protein product [Cylicostephanus goldi]